MEPGRRPIDYGGDRDGVAVAGVNRMSNSMHDVASQFEAQQDGKVFRVQIVVPL